MKDSLIYAVRDSSSYILKADVLDFYKDLANAQSTQFTILITVISVIFAIIMLATCWWNYRGAKSQISEEITLGIKDVETKFNSFKDDINQSLENMIDATLNTRLNESIKDFNNKIDEILLQQEKKLSDFQKDIDNKTSGQQAELSRVFAVHCESSKLYYNAFTWWFSAAVLYNELQNGEFTQIAVKASLESLKNIEQSDLDVEELTGYVQQVKDNVPDVLKAERDEMIKRIEELIQSKK